MQVGMNEEGQDNIVKELRFHGGKWGTAHGSYFSDPAKAWPLVDSALRAISLARPDVIADIGGGTGFLLGELQARLDGAAPRLVNVDVSPQQLAVCQRRGIDPLLCSLLDLRREAVAAEGQRLMLLSRSVMHYFGREGQDRFLAALRSVLREGELLVQQAACFATPREVRCMNLLYPMMGVDKFYMTPEELVAAHERNGLEVISVRRAPPLDLRSSDLAERYALDEATVERLCHILLDHGMDRSGFAVGDRRFRGPFTYRIVTARAV